MSRVLVTGATGFVGHTLCAILARSGYVVRAALRSHRSVPAGISEKVVIGDITRSTDWRAALRGVDEVFHVAARAHVLNDSKVSSDLYLETNAYGTDCFARASAQAGIRRFVYLSTVKVNGEDAAGGSYSAGDAPQPRDCYGVSKWLAEKNLMEIASRTGMEGVIVRSPIVYGPRVGANFLRLLHLVDREIPLPLGAVENRRSLVNIWNLCDLLVRVLEHPLAPGRTWMVSDGEDLSTLDLIRRLAAAMQRRVRIFPVPVGLLRLCGALTGRRAEISRLCNSLTVNITQTSTALGWSPPVPVNEGLARTVDWYLAHVKSRGA